MGGNAAETRKPNFLVVFTDDQTFRAIGYNNPEIKTPNLDRLAAEGLILNKAYVASPICAASRASIMTGLFPQQHGVIALNRGAFSPYLKGGSKADQTLANRLAAAGYHCAFYGKSHIGDPRQYGFSEGVESGPYNDVKTFELAEQFLERAAKSSKPFFLWVAPHQPHVPLKPEQRWLDLYDHKQLKLDQNVREAPNNASINNQGVPGEAYYRDSAYTRNWKNLSAGPPRNDETIRLFTKAYYATVSHLDDQIGRLVGRLRAQGLNDNTVFIFLSDNGYHLGNHGLGNKITMHEESVRVPMFVRWPAHVKKGIKSDALVSSLDVYPTLLELAGAAVPDDAMGKSLVPLLSNPASEIREVVFSECTGVGGKPGDGHRMARGKDWKYVLSDTNEQYLFDQSKDPFELKNLADEEGAELPKLQQSLATWMQHVGDRKYPYPAGTTPRP
ncbi:MAG: sulfatase [Fuerstiella sp.]|nr:sulfatase [Fuerstiella sp.]MCP4854794.1 sulfatase [Fuerstiella sp.]